MDVSARHRSVDRARVFRERSNDRRTLIAPAGQWRGEQRNGRTITAVHDAITRWIRSHSARRMQSRVRCPETDTPPPSPHVRMHIICMRSDDRACTTMIHAYHRTTIKAARAARGKLIRHALMLQQPGRNFVISAPCKSPEASLERDTLRELERHARVFINFLARDIIMNRAFADMSLFKELESPLRS